MNAEHFAKHAKRFVLFLHLESANNSRQLPVQSCVLAGQRGQARLPDHELIVVELWCSIERPFKLSLLSRSEQLAVGKVGLPPLIGLELIETEVL
jgi:hypothetical protein